MTHSRTVARLRISASIVGLALLASACASGLAFVQDKRHELTAPKSLTEITLPLPISWTIRDFRITGPDGASDPDAGYFGVFLDETPMPPGEPLSWVARDDRACGRTPGCPDVTYLSDRGIYATQETSVTFEQLPDQNAYRGNEFHELSIVLLDGTGTRIGESAWYVAFRYDRESS
ncbi:MAG: hypothetical protein ACRDKS_05270 [Actinomycetota bacterium]